MDFRALPLGRAAALAWGLGPESRIGRAMSGRSADTGDILLAVIADRLGDVLCLLSRGKVHPPPIAPGLLGRAGQAEGENMGFECAEDFRRAWEAVNSDGDRTG